MFNFSNLKIKKMSSTVESGEADRFIVRCSLSRIAAFTLVELLVVISIIAILIALLLPALARAKILALRIQCGSNMRQIGIAMQEYSNEYRGQYPPSFGAFWPMGLVCGYNGSTYTQYPMWGLGLLYYDSFGTNGVAMVNPRPGILNPTAQGISMLFSTQPGGFAQGTFITPSYYNSNGILTNWQFYSGYIYWVDRGKDWSQSMDNWNFGGGHPSYGYANDDPGHEPARRPTSSPGSILLTDEVFLNDYSTKFGGLTGFPFAGAVSSDHVDENNNALPDGAHELYNDGAVVWQPMSNIQGRWGYAGVILGW